MAMRTILIGASLLLAPLAYAGDEDDLSTVARALRDAIGDGNYIAASKALEKAAPLRDKADDDACKQLLAALVRGFKHKDESIAILCVREAGKLKIDGVDRHLNALLGVPKQPKRWNLRLAAVETAGELRTMELVPALERLLQHDKTPFATAAADSLGRYAARNRADRLELVKRLLTPLGRFEKKRGTTLTAKAHLSVVKARLLDALRKLAGKGEFKEAQEFRDWAREEEKLLKEAAKAPDGNRALKGN